MNFEMIRWCATGAPIWGVGFALIMASWVLQAFLFDKVVISPLMSASPWREIELAADGICVVLVITSFVLNFKYCNNIDAQS